MTVHMIEDMGQRFFDMRAKDDRDVIFADAGLLWETARAYFNYCIENPIKPANGEGGERFTPKVRAITLQGICYYMQCTPKWFHTFKEGLTADENNLSDKQAAVLEVILRIEQVVHMYKYNYAVAGLLNARMIIRDLELNEKKENNEKKVFKVRIEGA